ncbi:subtilisin-like protein [Aspergillus fijiensis CBS 313.89]|uniref:Subtilisin-like protein n=1 Tax=Aspergillus fijiensis CBS 313.89 TaxID=1448319 RepID=A0A8G1VZF0_9EURO|nr:subtilisin-like protein [Aspergillus fijiensis CBS 313.89]RAK77448.1 subtilisin-like protein [Aspergillus fijiensis CBS 313.89]
MSQNSACEDVNQGFGSLATLVGRFAQQSFPSEAAALESTFAVHELEVGELIRNPQAKPVLVCSRVRLSTRLDKVSYQLQLSCCCTEKHGHDELQYGATITSGYLCEEIRTMSARTWKEILQKMKTKARVILCLTATSVESASLVQGVSLRLMGHYLRLGSFSGPGLANTRAGGNVPWRLGIGPGICISFSQPVPVNTFTTTYHNGSENRVRLPDSAKVFLRHGHPEAIPTVQQRSPLLSGTSFEIWVSYQSIWNSESSHSMCLVAPETRVIDEHHPQGQLHVSLCNVSYRGKLAECVRLSFYRGEDATRFATCIRKIRQKISEISAQGSYQTDAVGYTTSVRAGLPGDKKTHAPTLTTTSDVAAITQDPVPNPPSLQASTPQDQPLATMPLPLDGDDLRFRSAAQMPPDPPQPHTQGQSAESGGVFVKISRQSTRMSDRWFDELDDLISVMKAPSEIQGRYRAVRVAVIDTGLQPAIGLRMNVIEWKDFVGSSSTMCDNTWHGTISATLLTNACEGAELYIARVFDTNNADHEHGPRLMAQAIEWAIDPTRRVDIISISAGFAEHSTVLQRAIDQASNVGVLIFAAASNWGNRGRVAFPARHNLKTMCIFSTNPDDQASSFNPEPREHADNFAILGEDLAHPADPTIRESGTSMATAIAAGLAARIIDFSRHADNTTIERVADVGSLAGMTAIFRFMSKRAGSFQCVSPLRLLPERHKYNEPERNRAYVRESLHRAMESAD